MQQRMSLTNNMTFLIRVNNVKNKLITILYHSVIMLIRSADSYNYIAYVRKNALLQIIPVFFFSGKSFKTVKSDNEYGINIR